MFGSRDADRISIAILALGDNPRPPGVRKFKRNIHRIRDGDWRIIYAIHDKENLVVVGKIVRRSEDTYNGVEDLL
jgi:mRNA-degrading endonuclease RelE of RelBE toxin-antitoxin system